MSEDANLKELTKRLATKKNLPKFEPVNLTLDMLIREGERLAYEQEMVNQHNLARDYFRNFGEVINLGVNVDILPLEFCWPLKFLIPSIFLHDICTLCDIFSIISTERWGASWPWRGRWLVRMICRSIITYELRHTYLSISRLF